MFSSLPLVAQKRFLIEFKPKLSYNLQIENEFQNMKKLSLQKLLQKRSEQFKASYDEYIQIFAKLKKRHLDEFTTFARNLEQKKIDEIRKSIKETL